MLRSGSRASSRRRTSSTCCPTFILRVWPGHIRSTTDQSSSPTSCRPGITGVGAQTPPIAPSSPWVNGYVESFNARLRDELLNGEIFYALEEAQIVIESWRRYYNGVRPHASLGYRPPAPEVFVPALSAGRLRSPDRLRRPSYPWSKGRPCTNFEAGPPRGGRSLMQTIVSSLIAMDPNLPMSERPRQRGSPGVRRSSTTLGASFPAAPARSQDTRRVRGSNTPWLSVVSSNAFVVDPALGAIRIPLGAARCSEDLHRPWCTGDAVGATAWRDLDGGRTCLAQRACPSSGLPPDKNTGLPTTFGPGS